MYLSFVEMKRKKGRKRDRESVRERVSERVSEREKQETDIKASTPNLLSNVSEITLWKETFGGVCFVAINDCVLSHHA